MEPLDEKPEEDALSGRPHAKMLQELQRFDCAHDCFWAVEDEAVSAWTGDLQAEQAIGD